MASVSAATGGTAAENVPVIEIGDDAKTRYRSTKIENSMAGSDAGSSTDCLSCRLIGGGGFVAASLYVLHYSKLARGSLGRTLYYVFSASLGYLGCARIVGLPPFLKPGNSFSPRRKDA